MEVKDSSNPYQGGWVHPFNTWIYRSFHKPEQNNSVNTCAVTNFETNFMPVKEISEMEAYKSQHFSIWCILVFGILVFGDSSMLMNWVNFFILSLFHLIYVMNQI